MKPARKSKALGWGVVAILLLAAAGVSYSRPAPPPIALAQLEARSAADAKTLADAIPAKVSDDYLSLEGVGDLPAVMSEIAKEPGVSAVRVWSPSGTLLASADPTDATAVTAAQVAQIAAASGAGAQSSSPAGQAGLHRTFEPVLPSKPNAVVAELVRSTTESGLPFKPIAAGLAIFGVLALIVALGSLRGGSDTEGAATSAAPVTAAPPQAGEPDDAGTERSAQRLAQKLKTSEASKAAMEIQMEQLRSQLRVGTQGSEQVMADLDNSLASSRQQVHEANEKLALAETRTREAEQRATIAEEALLAAASSEASDRLAALGSELAIAKAAISELEGNAAGHQARIRDGEARASEAERRADRSEARATQVEAIASGAKVTPVGAPQGDLSLAESSAPIAAPVIETAPPAPDAGLVRAESFGTADEVPAADFAGDPSAAGPGADDASATDPDAWRALAKSLRRDALGHEAGDETDEDEVPETPAAEVTDEDRSALRARLAKASNKKRRTLE